ncbi:MAG TPA: DegT/DnrJ/EryC1/StrS family aminotransferase [Solirubrobacteraceae bacterium]|jgi:dTDP-4-amino-4,6-dideoxygalactose transaminase|nr:DegT/DnrJ/EryC1/StrS family aminotransferase [Solirubrobacteraceae bacterium]
MAVGTRSTAADPTAATPAPAPIPMFKAAVAPGALDGVADVLAGGQLEHGPRAGELERAVGRRLGNRRVVAVDFGASALQLAVRLAAFAGGGAPGERSAAEAGEVLSVPLTFEATNWAILANGLRVRWVDVDPRTLSVDFDDLERKLSPATRAVMVVHWLGSPVDLDRLHRVVDAAEARLGFRPAVIEDGAQAWGAAYRGRPIGDHGNTTVFSLGAIKVLTAGSGGLLVVPDDGLEERARRLRWLGIDRTADRATGGYDVAEWGHRFTMNEVSAAIALANLEIVDGLVARARDNAAYFDEHLRDVPGLEHVERAEGAEPSFWAYPLKVDGRAAFKRKLAQAGIPTSIVARRNDAHTCMRDAAEALPGLDSVYDRLAYVPVGWWLSDDDRERIVDAICSGW